MFLPLYVCLSVCITVVTSTAALSAGEEHIAAEEEGVALVEDFWDALSSTGIQITTTHEAQL